MANVLLLIYLNPLKVPKAGRAQMNAKNGKVSKSTGDTVMEPLFRAALKHVTRPLNASLSDGQSLC